MNPDVIEVVHGRMNPMIDPQLHAWGWEVPVYLFLGGLVAGILVLLPALHWRLDEPPASTAVRFAPFAALVLLSLGMGALFLDLENKVNVWRFYAAFKITSPMSWGSWILVMVYPVLLLLGLGALTAADRARFGLVRERGGVGKAVGELAAWARANHGSLLMFSFVSGIALGSYTGLLLGTLSARLLWNSAILGPLFLVSGVSTGAAGLLLCGLTKREAELVLRWDVMAISVELGLLALLLLGFATGGRADKIAVAPLLGGDFTPQFWALVVVGGLLTPLAMELAELRRHLKPTLVAPALVLVGGLALRTIVVAAGQETSFALLEGGL